jgi:hypothetical protein
VEKKTLLQYLRKKTDVLLISTVAVVYLVGYMFYSRDVDFSLPSYDACIQNEPGASPISTKFADTEALHVVPDKTLADINALPNLPASGGLPDLHTMMRKDKEAESDELFDSVTYLSQRGFNDLLRGDDIMRNKVKDVIFAWAQVDAADPASRGPFMDARELEFLEKSKDEPYLQDGLYPNPAPLDAGRLRGEFSIAWNKYYADLMRQLAGKDLYDVYPVTDKSVLTPAGVDKLSKHAADMKTAEQKATYWTNVVRMVDPDPGTLLSTFEKSPNGVALDSAIHASVPPLTLDQVLDRIRQNPAVKADRYTTRDGRPIGFSVSYLPQKVRVVCYGFTDKPTIAITP